MRRPIAFANPYWLVILWIGVIFLATLVPLEPSEGVPAVWCVLCGDGALADGILNAALFVPLGAALSMAGFRPVRAVVLGALLSFAVETAQFVIPGRDPSLSDLLFNTFGTMVGIVLARSASAWWRPKPRMADALAIASTVGTGLVVAMTGFLFCPSFPVDTYYGGLTPRFGHLEWYGGRVLGASVGGLEIRSGLIAESAEVRRLLLSGATIRVQAYAGPQRPGLAPLFAIDDGHQREILLLGVDGDDLVYRYRTRAVKWGFLGPEIRVPGALRGIAWRDTLSVGVRSAGPAYCLHVNAVEWCGLGYTFGTGWALLVGVHSVPHWLQPALGVAWIAALLFPTGFYARPGWAVVASAALSFVSLLNLPATIGLLPTPAAEQLAALAGFLAGWVGRIASALLLAR